MSRRDPDVPCLFAQKPGSSKVSGQAHGGSCAIGGRDRGALQYLRDPAPVVRGSPHGLDRRDTGIRHGLVGASRLLPVARGFSWKRFSNTEDSLGIMIFWSVLGQRPFVVIVQAKLI